jgi:putative zinc finger/helix-turn-helix YgiT family protein
MKCEHCQSETIIRRQRYHYTECGLDNVYLEDIEVRVCPACGIESPRIPRITRLHDAIALAIVMHKAPLSGKAARYLRKHLGLKAREWAEYLRVDAATLSRWENDQQPIGSQADALMRLLHCYLYSKKHGHPVLDAIVEAIRTIDTSRQTDIPAVLVNPKYPDRYSYHPVSELACA